MFVSVIIPVYNAEKFLSYCVESLLGQSYGDLEVLLIDDGSTDGSAVLCDRYAVRDGRVRVFRQDNAGPSVARNRGIDQARGRYLMFVDADDYVERDIVAVLTAELEAGGAQLAVSMYKTHSFGQGVESVNLFQGVTSGTVSVKEYLDIRSLDIDDSFCVREKAHVAGNVWARLYVTDVVRAAGLRFHTGLNRYEDVLFNLSYMNLIERVCFVSRGLYVYCVRHGHTSLSERLVKNKFNMISSAYDALGPRYAQEPPSYVKYFFSYLIMGHLMRLFQRGSPYPFLAALAEMRVICTSQVYREAMPQYRLSRGASRAMPFFLKRGQFFLAAVSAKWRMSLIALRGGSVRQWCFSGASRKKQ